MELINKGEFANSALDENVKKLVVHIATLSAALIMQVRSLSQAHVSLLLADKALIKVASEYLNYVDIFLFDLIMEQSKNTSMNEHTIELIEGKQPPYGPIYRLEPVKLETLKTYIKTYLKTGFIQPSKFLVSVPIFFNQKSNGSLYLYIDYQDLNNLTIKKIDILSL